MTVRAKQPSDLDAGAGVKLLPVDADAAGMITAYYRSGGSPSPKSYGCALPYIIYALPDTEIESYGSSGSSGDTHHEFRRGSSGDTHHNSLDPPGGRW